MIRGVGFDLGGTLVDAEMPGLVYSRLLAERGITVEPGRVTAALRQAEAEMRHGVSGGMDEYYIGLNRLVLEKLGLDTGLAGYVHGSWFDHVSLERYPDTLPVIRRAGGMGLRLAMISNAFTTEIRHVCRSAGLPLDLFGAVVGMDTAGAPKPDPRPFLHAAGALGLRPDEMLFVGDDYPRDYVGSQAAGMRPVLLLRDGGPPPEAPDDITVIRALDELMDLLD